MQHVAHLGIPARASQARERADVTARATLLDTPPPPPLSRRAACDAVLLAWRGMAAKGRGHFHPRSFQVGLHAARGGRRGVVPRHAARSSVALRTPVRCGAATHKLRCSGARGSARRLLWAKKGARVRAAHPVVCKQAHPPSHLSCAIDTRSDSELPGKAERCSTRRTRHASRSCVSAASSSSAAAPPSRAASTRMRHPQGPYNAYATPSSPTHRSYWRASPPPRRRLQKHRRLGRALRQRASSGRPRVNASPPARGGGAPPAPRRGPREETAHTPRCLTAATRARAQVVLKNKFAAP